MRALSLRSETHESSGSETCDEQHYAKNGQNCREEGNLVQKNIIWIAKKNEALLKTFPSFLASQNICSLFSELLLRTCCTAPVVHVVLRNDIKDESFLALS